MNVFVWKARDKLGNEVVREIVAKTASEAKAILEAKGCTDLALIENEVSAAAQAGFTEKAELFGEEIRVSAADRIKRYNKPKGTLFSLLLEGIWQSKWLVAALVAFGAFEWYQGKTTIAWLAGVGLLFWLLFLVTMSLPSALYGRLHRAGDWHRWGEVMAMVGLLEKLRPIHLIKVPLPELGRWRAKVLAATGNLPEALEGYKQFENQPGCPGWLYKAFVAGLYDTAGQHERAVEWNLKSIAEKPTSTMYRDLANRYARYFHDPAKARAALAEADKEPAPELAKPFDIRCRGIVSLLEGDYPSARGQLEQAIALMEATRQVPFRDGSISVAKAYLCQVLAKQGDLKAARKNFDDARPYLIATDETDLIRECEQAVQR